MLSPDDLIFLRRVFLAISETATTREEIAAALPAAFDHTLTRDVAIVNDCLFSLRNREPRMDAVFSRIASEVKARFDEEAAAS